MDNRLRHLSGLRYFEVAARLSNYSKAAEELFVTQAAVSQKIRQLEEQLGCKLFIRKGRAMTLTHEGHTLFRHVSDGFQEVLLGLNKIQSEPIQGLLVVRSPPSFASRWLLPRLWKFSVKHPEIPIAHTISRGDVSTLGAPGEERKSVPDLLNERSCMLCCQGLDKLQYIRKFDTAVVVST